MIPVTVNLKKYHKLLSSKQTFHQLLRIQEQIQAQKMEPKLQVAFGFLAIVTSFYYLSFSTCAALFTSIITFKLAKMILNQDKNPFEHDSRKARKPYITDQRQRDKVIKQSFNIDKVPLGLDAIVIGMYH